MTVDAVERRLPDEPQAAQPAGDRRLADSRSAVPYRIILTALPILLVWSVIALYLMERHSLAMHVAAQDSRNLSKAFEENIRRSVDAIDTTIRAMRVARAHDPEHFDLPGWNQQSGLSRELTLQLSYADATGHIVGSDLGPVDSRISIADRDHFRGTKALPDDGLFISDPVIGRISHRWSVQFVRKLLNPDGSFDGVVAASFDPAFLLRFYESLDIGDAAVLILGSDDVLKAGASKTEMTPGMDLSATELAVAARAADRGTITADDVVDHTRRIYSWRKVSPYDLIVVVGLSHANALADYQRHLLGFILLGVCVSGLVIAVDWALARNRRAIVQSRAILQAAVENISQGLLVVGADRTVPLLNSRAAELLDLPRSLAQPGVAFDRLLMFQLESGEFDNEPDVQKLVRAGGISSHVNSTYRRTRRNGTVLEFTTRLVDSGLAVRTITDITEQERNAAVLAEARDAAEAAARAHSEFLAVMSHEIRTPLNGVIGVAGLLEGLELGAAQREYVRLIRQSGDHLLGLVNDILDFSRLNAARLQLDAVAFDPRVVAEEVVAMLRPQADAKGLALAAELAPSVVGRVIGDPGRLRQVLINLVGNAVKFTDTGWVRLILDASRDAESLRLEVTVADSGIGIAADAIERMFTAFTQADSSISRRYGGSGLGLAICRRLVELMGGAISVESKPNEGSVFRFCVTLPIDQAHASEAGQTAPQRELESGLRVLVAEDNATNRLVALKLLERLGCRADAVSDGVEALKALQTQAYDLVLMDVMMPEMDGLAATRAIRNGETADRHIPIVGLTAQVRSENLEECKEAGMDAVTTKPVTADSLRTAIAEGLAVAAERTQPAAAPVVATKTSPRLAELTEMLGEEAVRKILATFVADMRANLTALREAAGHGEAEKVHRLAHAVAGAARNVGAADLAARASALEAQAGSLSAQGMSVQEMVVEASLLEAALDSFLMQFGVATG